jgi:CheY-like chemotaxis protein
MSAILVVDDEQAIRFLLVEVLTRDDHQVTTATDGDVAVEKLRLANFDLVITDLHMHDVDGIGVLRAAKKKQPNTEVLILTGRGTVSSAVEAMRLGAFEYLTKPIDLEELRLKVRQALEHREMRMQIEAQRREIQAHQQMISRDLKLAAQVQQSLVPPPFVHPHIEVSVHHPPMIGVGGDFSDVYFDGNDQLYISLIDVTKHGIAAALLVNHMSSEIRHLVHERLDPQTVLHQFNHFIVESFAGTGMFLTMFTCTLQLSRGHLTSPARIQWPFSGVSHPKFREAGIAKSDHRFRPHSEQFKHDATQVVPATS